MTRYRMRLRRPAFRGIAVPFVRREHVAFRLLVVGALSCSLLGVVWWWATQTVSGQRLDDLVLYGGQAAADQAALALASQTLGLVSLASALAATAGLALLALSRGGAGLSLAVLVSVGGANVTAQVLKRTLDRPDLLGQLAYATGNSFPSGHVTLVASIAFAAILLAPRRLRGLLTILAAISVALIGVSTISLAWHRPADVIGAMLVALAWASLTSALVVRLQGWMPRRTWTHGLGGALVGSVAAVGGIAVVAGALVLALGDIAGDALEHAIAVAASNPSTFLAALAASAGASLIGFAAYDWGMNGVALEST